MFEWVKVFALFIGMLLCVASINQTLASVSGRRWIDIGQAVERDGYWHLWIFEQAIPEVRLSDMTHAHRCPTCKGVSR